MIQTLPYTESNCCGARMHNYPDSDVCPDCKEHCEPYEDDDWADEEHDVQREEMKIIYDNFQNSKNN